MSRSSFLFTSESVSEGHPDKVADRISDTVVDLFLSKDPEARVACETLTTTNLVVLAGEIRGNGIMGRDGPLISYIDITLFSSKSIVAYGVYVPKLKVASTDVAFIAFTNFFTK